MNNVYTVEEIFSGRILQIPNYQRGYAWDRHNWDDFLEDLELLEADKQHYTGTLVLHDADQSKQFQDEEGSKYKALHVVDGQQRLTTIVLLLDAVRRELGRLGKSKLAEGIKKSYIAVPDFHTGQPLLKLQLNRDTHDFFVDNVLSDHPGPEGAAIRSQERLIGAKRYFLDYLAGQQQALGEDYETWLLGLYNKVTSQLKVSLYNVEKSSEVGVIFEVMNNRGKPLSELEKVKNYLLYASSKLSVENHDLGERINHTWTNIFERLMASGLIGASPEDQLLRIHWLIAYDYRRKYWSGSQSIKDKFSLKGYKDNHKELLDELLWYAKSLDQTSLAYCDIVNPRRTDAFSALDIQPKLRDEVQRASEKLVRIGAVATFLPLLAATRLRFPEDGEKYLRMVNTCEVFAFRVYRLLEKRANTGEPTLLRLAYQLYSEERPFEEVLENLQGTLLHYCPDRQFEQAFEMDEDENIWYPWSGLKYFLYEYEEYLADGKPVQLPWETLEGRRLENTVEHILPQTPNHRYWTSRFNKSTRQHLTHDIGNLCLTYNNSSYGNKPFPEKRGEPGQDRPCFANSTLFQEKRLARLEEWNAEELRERRSRIVDWALSRWRVDRTTPLHPEPDEVDDALSEPDEELGTISDLEAAQSSAG